MRAKLKSHSPEEGTTVEAHGIVFTNGKRMLMKVLKVDPRASLNLNIPSKDSLTEIVPAELMCSYGEYSHNVVVIMYH